MKRDGCTQGMKVKIRALHPVVQGAIWVFVASSVLRILLTVLYLTTTSPLLSQRGGTRLTELGACLYQIALAVVIAILALSLRRPRPAVRLALVVISLIGFSGPESSFIWLPMVLSLMGCVFLYLPPAIRMFSNPRQGVQPLHSPLRERVAEMDVSDAEHLRPWVWCSPAWGVSTSSALC
jgi:hypothetical protein